MRGRARAFCSAAKGIFWRLLHPLIVKMMAKHDSKQVEMLKAVVEVDRPKAFR